MRGYTSRFIPVLLLGISTLLYMDQALAWGAEGHRITGYIAQALLTDKARDEVEALIPNADFAELALYMDQHKVGLTARLPDSSSWHYDNIEVCGNDKDPCADGNCATEKIADYAAILANKAVSSSKRREALIFLLHLVGDIHQPLHAATHQDRGGNDVRIQSIGSSTNLHAFWDIATVLQLLNTQTEQQWAQHSLSSGASYFPRWQTGSARDWSTESHDYAVSVAYGGLPGFSCHSVMDGPVTLSAEYQNVARAVAARQLMKAGARIAYVLNKALDQAICQR